MAGRNELLEIKEDWTYIGAAPVKGVVSHVYRDGEWFYVAYPPETWDRRLRRPRYLIKGIRRQAIRTTLRAWRQLGGGTFNYKELHSTLRDRLGYRPDGFEDFTAEELRRALLVLVADKSAYVIGSGRGVVFGLHKR